MIKAVSSTMGHENPSLALGGGYCWRKIPGWKPGDVRYKEDSPARPAGGAYKITQRERRLMEFTAYRASGLSVTEAGQRVGVAPVTARAYERARLAEIREGSDG